MIVSHDLVNHKNWSCYKTNIRNEAPKEYVLIEVWIFLEKLYKDLYRKIAGVQGFAYQQYFPYKFFNFPQNSNRPKKSMFNVQFFSRNKIWQINQYFAVFSTEQLFKSHFLSSFISNVRSWNKLGYCPVDSFQDVGA